MTVIPCDSPMSIESLCASLFQALNVVIVRFLARTYKFSYEKNAFASSLLRHFALNVVDAKLGRFTSQLK